MGLPWVRMDTNTPSHDKILSLISDPSPKRWQAVASWHFAIQWAGGHGTDGLIPVAALPFVHGTQATARLLVKHQLWDEFGVTGWQIRNFDRRQPINSIAETVRQDKRRAGAKGNCKRHHDPTCWTEGEGCHGIAK